MDDQSFGRLIQRVEDLKEAHTQAADTYVRRDVCSLNRKATGRGQSDLERRVAALEAARDQAAASQAAAAADAGRARRAMWATIVVGVLALVGTLGAALINRWGR